MDDKDLKQIEKLFENGFTEGFKHAFTSVWEHNLEPALTAIHGKIDQLPTKSYLDSKLGADLTKLCQLQVFPK